MPNYRDYMKDGNLALPAHLVDYPEALFITDDSEIETLGNLRSIRGQLYLSDCARLKDLGSLATVDGPVNCMNCPELAAAPHLRSAKGFINLIDTKITKLSDCVSVAPLLPSIKPRILLASDVS